MATRYGRWSLVPRRAGAQLRYEPAGSASVWSVDLSAAQLEETSSLAKQGNAKRIRDLLLGTDVQADLFVNAQLSSLVSASTWRWALPLFGGPKPPHPGRGRRAASS